MVISSPCKNKKRPHKKLSHGLFYMMTELLFRDERSCLSVDGFFNEFGRSYYYFFSSVF